jgi:hypothetical protein
MPLFNRNMAVEYVNYVVTKGGRADYHINDLVELIHQEGSATISSVSTLKKSIAGLDRIDDLSITINAFLYSFQELFSYESNPHGICNVCGEVIFKIS